jgi:tetratricopeptide (TPR) repeat protein
MDYFTRRGAPDFASFSAWKRWRLKMNSKNELYNNIVSGNYEIENVNKRLQSEKGIDCYLALVSALKRDIYTAQQHIIQAQGTELSQMDCLVCLEAKVVISYFCGNFSEVEKYAAEALTLSNRAFFARSLLARVFSWKKRFHEAIEQYKILLEMYPFHSSTLLI